MLILNNKKNHILLLILALLSALLIGVLWPGLALADGPINVTTDTDEFSLVPNGRCSLREAIQSANHDVNFGGCTRGGTRRQRSRRVDAAQYRLGRPRSGRRDASLAPLGGRV